MSCLREQYYLECGYFGVDGEERWGHEGRNQCEPFLPLIARFGLSFGALLLSAWMQCSHWYVKARMIKNIDVDRLTLRKVDKAQQGEPYEK